MYKKLIKSMFLLIIFVPLMSACGNNKYLVFPGNFDTVTPQSPLTLPYIEDFESGVFENVQDFNPGFKWQIVNEGENKVLKCVAVDEGEFVSGRNVFNLMVGAKSWEGYIFSFDFKLEGETFIIFAPYADTNHTYDTPASLGRNSWSLRLNSDGELIHNTVFAHGSHHIIKNPDVTEGFKPNEWNHIELIPVGLDLTMKMNGVDIGRVAGLQEGNTGRVTIGGGVGCMFDNLKIEAVSTPSEPILPPIENTPVFLDADTARKNLEPFIFLDCGWMVYHSPSSPYIYAHIPRSADLYLIRYNILENTVDRSVKLDKLPKGYQYWMLTFSPGGELVFGFNDGLSMIEPINFFLMDFENSEVSFLAEELEFLNLEQIPENENFYLEVTPYYSYLRFNDNGERLHDFDRNGDPIVDYIGWNVDTQNLNLLDFEIEREYDGISREFLYFAADKTGKKHELTSLKSNIFDTNYVVIDSNTIATLLPVYQDRHVDLGYYKFVLIDVATDTVMQEFAINE
ncbi:MAG: hypothetical protein FWG90_06470 [Oscillospiraceae bacterium]|nr:hypothetical protein [Oscillospiraceae bacterium]